VNERGDALDRVRELQNTGGRLCQCSTIVVLYLYIRAANECISLWRHQNCEIIHIPYTLLQDRRNILNAHVQNLYKFRRKSFAFSGKFEEQRKSWSFP